MTERIVLPIHGQDHCPGGPDPIPCLDTPFFRAIRTTNITSISTTSVAVDWEIWQNGHPSIFDPRKADATAAVQGTDDARYIRIRQPGLYTISIGLSFLSSFEGCRIALNDGDAPWGLAEALFTGPNSSYSLTGFAAWTFSRIYPLIDPFDSDFANELVLWPANMGPSGGLVDLSLTTAIFNASPITLDAAFIEVTYRSTTFPSSTAWPPEDG